MTTTQEHDPVIRTVSSGRSTTLRLRDVRLLDRLLARLRSGSLDAELACGLAPNGAWLRAVRAAQLTAPAARAQLADGWAEVLEHAEHPTLSLVRVPLNIDAVLSAHTLITAVIAELRRPGPVPARAVALAHRLLTDGTGPLYRRGRSSALGSAVADTLAAFDSV